MTEDQDRELEARLDDAARWCQPRHPGWPTLLNRLGPQQPGDVGWDSVPTWDPIPTPPETPPLPPSEPNHSRPQTSRSRVRRLRTLAAGLLLAGALIGLLALVGHKNPEREAVATGLDVEVQRRGIDLTIFNPSESQEPTLYMPLVGWPGQGGLSESQGYVAQQVKFPHVAQASQVQMAEGPMARHPLGPAARGMGLIKDQRMVLHLKRGDNIVKFTDVAATIDPTSVRLTSETDPTGLQVVEQNFEFDLASADALLKRSLEHRITCIGKDDQAAVEGFLLSYDAETLVLADRPPNPKERCRERPPWRSVERGKASSGASRNATEGVPYSACKAPRPKTQSIARRTLKAIRLDEVPQDLYTRPTLVWKLRAKKPGDHLATLTYLCGHITWQADYVVTIVRSDPQSGDTLDLAGWVTIDNRSGATYEHAGLKLIAGDVNRVRDPWAPPPQPILAGFVGTAMYRIEPRKELIVRDFFEYKLYALNLPSTIREGEIKQLSLLQAKGIKAQRRFLYDARGNHPLTTELVVKNEKANGLGRPLPKGRVMFVAPDADGESQFLGRSEIDHTPKDETLTLKVGEAFDVVGQSSILRNEVPHPRRLIQTSEIRVRNHKDIPIQVRAIADLLSYRTNWQVTQSTDAYQKHDFQTLYFDFRMKPNSEKTLTYTVDYQW